MPLSLQFPPLHCSIDREFETCLTVHIQGRKGRVSPVQWRGKSSSYTAHVDGLPSVTRGPSIHCLHLIEAILSQFLASRILSGEVGRSWVAVNNSSDSFASQNHGSMTEGLIVDLS